MRSTAPLFAALCFVPSALAQEPHDFSVDDMLAMQRISDPQVSPDGRWVAFNRGDKLVKVAIDGGTPIALATEFWGGGAWGRDGRIVFPNHRAEPGHEWFYFAQASGRRLVSRPPAPAA